MSTSTSGCSSGASRWRYSTKASPATGLTRTSWGQLSRLKRRDPLERVPEAPAANGSHRGGVVPLEAWLRSHSQADARIRTHFADRTPQREEFGGGRLNLLLMEEPQRQSGAQQQRWKRQALPPRTAAPRPSGFGSVQTYPAWQIGVPLEPRFSSRNLSRCSKRACPGPGYRACRSRSPDAPRPACPCVRAARIAHAQRKPFGSVLSGRSVLPRCGSRFAPPRRPPSLWSRAACPSPSRPTGPHPS
jgi:hypothetical protein